MVTDILPLGALAAGFSGDDRSARSLVAPTPDIRLFELLSVMLWVRLQTHLEFRNYTYLLTSARPSINLLLQYNRT